MAKLTKELLEQVYYNKDLTSEEKTKVLQIDHSTMYKALKNYGLPTLIKRGKQPKQPKQITLEEAITEEVHVDARVPNHSAYNIHLTVRFKSEEKEDFLAALEMLLSTCK